MYTRINCKDAQPELPELIDRVIAEDETVVIRRRPGAYAVLMSIRELRSLLESIHLLKDPESATRLLDAIERADRGEGIRISPEELAREYGLWKGDAAEGQAGVAR